MAYMYFVDFKYILGLLYFADFRHICGVRDHQRAVCRVGDRIFAGSSGDVKEHDPV